jgi:hypothetical protein
MKALFFVLLVSSIGNAAKREKNCVDWYVKKAVLSTNSESEPSESELNELFKLAPYKKLNNEKNLVAKIRESAQKNQVSMLFVLAYLKFETGFNLKIKDHRNPAGWNCVGLFQLCTRKKNISSLKDIDQSIDIYFNTIKKVIDNIGTSQDAYVEALTGNLFHYMEPYYSDMLKLKKQTEPDVTLNFPSGFYCDGLARSYKEVKGDLDKAKASLNNTKSNTNPELDAAPPALQGR